MSLVTFHQQKVKSGASVHYAAAGDSSHPVVLLLHGFPSSNHQYRNLIPRLAKEGYRVYAPDLPGFGHTELPSNFTYTFDKMASVIMEWLDALKLERFVVYMFDYGAPTAERIALARPDAIRAIITQNGNAYVEGLGPNWQPLQEWWKDERTGEMRNMVRGALQAPPKDQYVEGTPEDRLDRLDPSTWALDFLQNIQPKNDIQLDLFFDYQNNLKLYPAFQKWMKEKHLPVLAIWGKGDKWFIPPGAEAFKRDADAKVILLDAGHFALETHLEEILHEMIPFLKGLKW